MSQDSTNHELDVKDRDKIGRVTSGAPAQPPVSDLYFYLTTVSWPKLLLIIVGLFGFINCLFAIGYMIDGGVANARPGSFADAFFFSVQTMATIGYGVMAPRSFVSNMMVSIEALSGLALARGRDRTDFRPLLAADRARALQPGRGDLAARRSSVADVPGGEPALQPHRRGADPRRLLTLGDDPRGREHAPLL